MFFGQFQGICARRLRLEVEGRFVDHVDAQIAEVGARLVEEFGNDSALLLHREDALHFVEGDAGGLGNGMFVNHQYLPRTLVTSLDECPFGRLLRLVEEADAVAELNGDGDGTGEAEYLPPVVGQKFCNFASVKFLLDVPLTVSECGQYETCERIASFIGESIDPD